MLFFDSAFGLVLFALWVFCLIDAITTDGSACRNLPKPVWVLVVLLLADVGAVLWLVAGRPWPVAKGTGPPHGGNAAQPVQPAPPARTRLSRARTPNPDDDENFLAQLRARAEEQRRSYREEQRRRDTEEGQD